MAGGGFSWNASPTTGSETSGFSWNGDHPKGTAPPLKNAPTPISRAVGAAKAVGDRALAGLQWASETPVGRGIDTALSAGARMGTAAVAGKNPLRAVIDPAQATQTTHLAEHRLLHDVAGIPDVPASWWKSPIAPLLRADQFALDFATETLLDPTTYLGGPIFKAAGKGLKFAASMAGKVPGAERASDALRGAFVEGHDLRGAATRPGENIVKGREIAGRDAIRRNEQRYSELVDQHRDKLDAIDQRQRNIVEQLKRVDGPARAGHQPSIAAANALQEAWKQTVRDIPPEIRMANLERAYVEGAPEVRRKALAAGFRPTEEQASAPVLNILHGFNEEYEPTQRLYDATQLEASSGPVRYIAQGNRKGTFDLRKEGGLPEDPLADRIRDRLVRGARLEQYHATRRKILHDLGLTGDPNVSRTRERYFAARDAGDERAAQRYGALLRRQLDALADTKARRALNLKSEGGAEQRLELLDPLTARSRAQSDLILGGEIGPRELNTKGRLTGIYRPRGGERETATMEARLASGKRGLLDTQAVRKMIEGAATRTGVAGQRLAKDAAAARAQTATAADRAFPAPATPLLNAQGRPVDVPRVTPPEPNASAADARAQIMGAAEPPPPLVGGKPRRLPISEVRRRLYGSGEDHRLTTGPQRPAGPILDAQGRPTTRPRATDRQRAAIEGPIAKLATTIRERTGPNRAAFAHLVNPSQRAAEQAGARAGRAEHRVAQQGARLVDVRRQNDAIQATAQLADQLGDAANMIEMPPQLKRRLFEAKSDYEKSLLGKFSDLQRDALFVLPFAHQKNITVLALLGPGGTHVVTNGWRYFGQLQRDPAALAHRVRGLEEIGASSHYLRDVEPAYASFLGKKVGGAISDFAARGNQALENYDLAMRMALQDELERKGIRGFDAGGEIRDTLGDYENRAPAIDELRKRAGANFPAWRLGIVPRAMTKSLRERPLAMQRYARLERLFSDDVTAPMFNSQTDVAGPADDFGQMLFPRPAFSNFYLSPSTIGPISTVVRAAIEAGRGSGRLGEVLGQEALAITPYGSAISAATGFPYPSNMPAPLRIGAGLAGSYFPPVKTRKQRANQLRQLGIKGPEATRILNSEFPPLAPPPASSSDAGGFSWAPAAGGFSWNTGDRP